MKCVKSLSCVRLFVTPWTVAYMAPLSMEFSRQEYWSGLPFPSPGDLPDPEIKPASPALAGGFFNTEPPGKPFMLIISVTEQTRKFHYVYQDMTTVLLINVHCLSSLVTHEPWANFDRISLLPCPD